MKRRVIALGFFDGVHKGHGALLTRAVTVAQRIGAVPCAMTFNRHPDALILGQGQPLLNTIEDREDLMTRLYGIREILLLPFDEHLMHTPWEQFLSDILLRRCDAIHLVVGHDFHFGYLGEGNASRLAAACHEAQIGCDIVPEVTLEGITISSTYIRRLVAQGDMPRAELFLGHPHVLTGAVAHGRRLGTTLGAPTLNLVLPQGIVSPCHGVYLTKVFAGGTWWYGVTNVGIRPTVTTNNEVLVETTLLDFSGDLYGQDIRVEFAQFMRPEYHFAELEQLKQQIQADIRQARQLTAG